VEIGRNLLNPFHLIKNCKSKIVIAYGKIKGKKNKKQSRNEVALTPAGYQTTKKYCLTLKKYTKICEYFH
jgi:hypothetical protein